jgi:hypothetical protein
LVGELHDGILVARYKVLSVWFVEVTTDFGERFIRSYAYVTKSESAHDSGC